MLTAAKQKRSILLLHLFLWVISILVIAWLWDKWLLESPNGNMYRWVGMDFAPFWVGVREMLHGVSPYTPETNLKIQEIVYGSQAQPGQDPMMFVYPAWMFLLIAPFSMLPYPWAVILYEGSLLWGLLLFLYKIAATLEHKRNLTQALWFLLLALGSLPFIVISVTKGQLGYLSLLALFAAYTTWKDKPVWAGIFLSLALIKPTVTVAPVAGFLLWALLHKNWRFLSTFSACMLILLTTSYLAVGNWIPGYLKMLSITGGMPVFWSFSILQAPINLFHALFFILLSLISFFYSFTKKEHDYWFSSMVLLGISLTPIRWIYDLFAGILLLAEKRTFSRPKFLAAGISILSPWLLIFAPESIRWNLAVIGLPLFWAATLLLFIISENLKTK